MAWKTLDWLALEADEFDDDLDDLIVKIHEASTSRLEELLVKRLQRADEEYTKANDETEREIAFQLHCWEEDRGTERAQILGGLELVYLVSVFQAKLNQLKRHLEKTHPPAPPYEGGGWLDRQVREYLQRFGIDMERSPEPFLAIRELVLARNCVVHNDRVPSDDYLQLVKNPKYVDMFGKISFSSAQFIEAVGILKGYVRWLVNQLICVRDHVSS